MGLLLTGRAFGRGGHSFNQTGFQGSSRGFYQRGRGQPGMGFANEHDIDTPYASFQGRQNFGRGFMIYPFSLKETDS